MVCCFFGHRDLREDVRPALHNVVEQLILEGTTSFFVGNQGAFDAAALCVLRKLKLKYPQIDYAVVLAYMPGEKSAAQLYAPEETLYPEGLETVHPRYAIAWRNSWLVKMADVVVCYITHDWGGAAKYAAEAQRKKRRVIHLAHKHQAAEEEAWAQA